MKAGPAVCLFLFSTELLNLSFSRWIFIFRMPEKLQDFSRYVKRKKNRKKSHCVLCVFYLAPLSVEFKTGNMVINEVGA
jgi:hypothetical protein